MQLSNDSTLTQVYSVLEWINAAESAGDVKTALDPFLKSLGLSYFVIIEMAGIPGDRRLRLGNYPREWSERYFKYRYESRDPISLSLPDGGTKVPWSKIRQGLSRSTKGWRILNEAKEFGLADGWAFAIPGPQGSVVAAAYGGPAIDDHPLLRPTLHIISMYVNARLSYLSEQRPTSNVRLTAREAEIMRLVAYGRTDTDIAHMLGIKETTVHMHIENVKRKLGVQKRVTAIVEALKLRLLLL